MKTNNCINNGSYDTRGTNAKTPSHWRDEEILEDRAAFRAGREPAELIINPVLVIISFIIIIMVINVLCAALITIH